MSPSSAPRLQVNSLRHAQPPVAFKMIGFRGFCIDPCNVTPGSSSRLTAILKEAWTLHVAKVAEDGLGVLRAEAYVC